MALPALMTAMMAGINLRELGPEEEDLSRIVYPEQYDDQRAGCAIAGGDGSAANVKADQELTDGEQEAVTNAPIKTSCHSILLSGRTL